MEANNQENNTLDLSTLNKQERKERLFSLLRSFPAHVSYSERTNLIAARAGMSHKSLLQLARRNGWAARLAVEIAAEKERAEYNAQLQATAPQAREASSIQVAGSIRGLAFTLLGAARRYVDTLCLSLAYYSDKIALRIAESGGLAHLDATAAREVAELQGKLSYTAKQLQPYMVPSALGSLLSIIDFTSRLPVNQEEVETTHFTIGARQESY